MGKNDGDNKWDFIDIISILSFIIGLENLELNQKQVSNLSDQYNQLLAKIIQQNEEIIQLLKEKK